MLEMLLQVENATAAAPGSGRRLLAAGEAEALVEAQGLFARWNATLQVSPSGLGV
jgi:hypothetical protein